jgi:cyclin-dependent kinase-like
MAEIVDGEPLLPGESEIDQLCLIQATIGPLPESLWGTFVNNPNFMGLSIATSSNQSVIEDRYLTRMPKKAVSLLRKLVEVDPNKRIRADQALKDPYFEKKAASQAVIVGRQQRHFPTTPNLLYRA